MAGGELRGVRLAALGAPADARDRIVRDALGSASAAARDDRESLVERPSRRARDWIARISTPVTPMLTRRTFIKSTGVAMVTLGFLRLRS